MDFNNREIATLIWLGVLLAALLTWQKTRSSLLLLLRMFFKRIFLVVFGIAAVYVAACVALLSALDIWTAANAKTTAVWAITVGFVSMFDLNRIDEDRTYFRKTIRDTLSFTVLLVFIAEFHAFPLWVELPLLPVIVLVGLMQATAETEPEHALVHRYLGRLMVALGMSFIGYSVYQTAMRWSEFVPIHTLREFFIPILLTLMFLPLLYGLSVYTVYDRIFSALGLAIKDDGLRRYAKRKALWRFRLNLDLLKRWRRLVMLEQPDTREAITRSFSEVTMLYEREKNPPVVDPSEGWSPYAAMTFLAGEGIESGDYHRIHDRWQSNSKFLKLDQKALSNSIVYYVEGSELVADELTLELMVNHVELGEDADFSFRNIGEILLRKALGDRAVPLLAGSFENFETGIEGSHIRLETEEWSINKFSSYQRTLTIRHGEPADS